jgi:glycosyltransferase involved in cell wall biosynthesis
MNSEPRVAVLIPCHNEAATIGKVVDEFRAALAEAVVYVADNCSTDATADVAARHGALVLNEPRQGKGFALEGLLDRVDADYYLMVDGDDTYPADKARDLLAPVMADEADMAVGARLGDCADGSFRPMHRAGNSLVRGLINRIFGTRLTDILSGYRAFSRKVVQRIPVVSAGFEVETELTIHMLYYRLRVVEVPVPYRRRPEGSHSKLRTVRDGLRVLWKLLNLTRAAKPLTVFGGLSILLFVLGLLAGIPPVADYVRHAAVYHPSMAILAAGLMVLSAGSFAVGLILHAMNWRFLELHNVLVRGGRRNEPR